MSPQEAINVLIVDDSVVVRRIMTRIFAQDPRFTVTGAVSTGERALAHVRSHPVNLVLLDMQMPGLDGLEVLPRLLAGGAARRVVVLSASCREGSALALQALARGASDVVAKPSAGHFNEQFVAHLLDRLVHFALPAERSHKPEASDQARIRLRPPGTLVRAIGIGGSTGGIGAIMALLAGLEGDLRAPVFITQHLPANFQLLFAEQLRRATGRTVIIAEEGIAVQPGAIHVAPGLAHLSLRRDARGQCTIRLSQEPCLHGGVPAVDPMFMGMAHVYGAGACGVILSGMGRDGLAGAQAIVEAGGWIIAQDHPSSAVWGMPGSFARAGLASAILPPPAIAALILARKAAA